MSLVGVIEDFAAEQPDGGLRVVTRAGAQTVTDGMLSEAAGTTFEIVALIQPARGRALELAGAEAKHVSAEYVCFTATAELLVNDSILFKGQDWRLATVKHWEEWGEEHWVATMTKVQVNP